MRKILITIVILLLSSPCFATNYCNDANVEACYLFEEGSGTTVDNAEGTAAKDGTFKASGEPAWDTTDVDFATSGSAANSVNFDGQDDYISLGSDASIDSLTTFTIVIWVLVDATGDSSYPIIIGNAGTELMVWLTNNTIEGVVRCATTDGKSYTNTSAFSLDAWFHLAMTYNTGGDKKPDVFKDGSELTYASSTACAGGETDVSANDWRLGQYATSLDRSLDGQITETAIFSDVLTSTEINDIYDYGLEGVAAATTRRLIF